MFRRPQYGVLAARLAEPRRFLQILAGPRQVGKTTLARQVAESFGGETHYATADLPATPDPLWIEQQWRLGRMLAAGKPALLVLDEIQKVPRWSETVKRMWEEDSHSGTSLRVVLLGSSRFLLDRGLTESLAGRFELIRAPHWSLAEMREAFGWNVETYVYFGGYPGAASLATEPARWKSYILDSIIEPTLARDVLQLVRIDKPALLRRLFMLGCTYSAQVLSYQKMIGQLQDAGNTTTLAHYLELLGRAWMLTGLSKFTGEAVRSRGSSPKLLALNPALVSAQLPGGPGEAYRDGEIWGRLVESTVGAHLANLAPAAGLDVFWWSERGREVDFVLRQGRKLLAIEVKSGRRRGGLPGLEAFVRQWPRAEKLVVGTGGIELARFLDSPPEAWL
jgi:predicted AAA+ superfamily ATPase